jgi:hypothetical protein
MNLNIDIDYKRTAEEIEQSGLNNKELTENYLNWAVSSFYKDGLEGQKRRIWGRIQRKIDDAVEGNGKVELETAEKEFLVEAMKGAKFPAGISKFVMILEDVLLKEESEKPNKEDK